MTNRMELAKTMQERVLTLGEILKHAFGLLNERFSSFFFLKISNNPISFFISVIFCYCVSVVLRAYVSAAPARLRGGP